MINLQSGGSGGSGTSAAAVVPSIAYTPSGGGLSYQQTAPPPSGSTLQFASTSQYGTPSEGGFQVNVPSGTSASADTITPIDTSQYAFPGGVYAPRDEPEDQPVPTTGGSKSGGIIQTAVDTSGQMDVLQEEYIENADTDTDREGGGNGGEKKGGESKTMLWIGLLALVLGGGYVYYRSTKKGGGKRRRNPITRAEARAAGRRLRRKHQAALTARRRRARRKLRRIEEGSR